VTSSGISDMRRSRVCLKSAFWGVGALNRKEGLKVGCPIDASDKTAALGAIGALDSLDSLDATDLRASIDEAEEPAVEPAESEDLVDLCELNEEAVVSEENEGNEERGPNTLDQLL
jgi:hypothetical protein